MNIIIEGKGYTPSPIGLNSCQCCTLPWLRTHADANSDAIVIMRVSCGRYELDLLAASADSAHVGNECRDELTNDI